MEAKKVFYTGGSLSVIGLLLLTACGAKPDIKFEMANCDDIRILELGPGDIVDLTDVDPKINFQIDEVGRVNSPPNENFRILESGTLWEFGDPAGTRYIVRDQGDLNGNGLTDILIQKICPVQSTPTPIGFLKGNVRSVVQADRGFHPGKASKPVFTSPLRRI